MAKVSLRHVYKTYEAQSKKEKDFTAVKDFSMEIEDNEFVVFVGPSGCGKSTTLRMIAGLEDISDGEIYIDDVLINDLEPKDRDIAMVFQNYALYPHMTAYNNIAFGLKMKRIEDIKVDKDGNPVINPKTGKVETIKRHYTKQEIDERVLWAAKVLDIENLLNRRPREMSGGQRQRIALGRAMVRNPKVFLLDEPLSNLDAKLRAAMRVEITKLHQALKTTFIYVTHDQVEAMTMGDRIVVMKDGIVQQIDTPTNLFDYPVNQFVAGFIGTPQMNFFDAVLSYKDNKVNLTFKNTEQFKLSYDIQELGNINEKYLDGQEYDVVIGVRGEDIVINEDGFAIKVGLIEVLGNSTHIYFELNGMQKDKEFVMITPERTGIRIGDNIKISFKHIHLFDKETEESIIAFQK